MHLPDRANRTLLVTAAAAVLAATLAGTLTPEFARLCSAAGVVILLLGALRLASLHGARAALLERFVSPAVNSLMDRDGLPGDTEHDLSIVYADIRSFTRFTATTESSAVMRFLREYYEAVGAAVASHGATVKDYAGDGILILVGATRPLPDHADRAIAVARAVREAAREVTDRWSTAELPLGIGVGLASGVTALGMVGGGSERMEYAAVGPAVNLAARLCSEAAADEILIDERTLALSRERAGVRQRETGRSLALKGIAEPVTGFAL